MADQVSRAYVTAVERAGAWRFGNGNTHIPVSQYKKAQRLDKQAEKIKQSREDITMFNVGKKREEALEALAVWLPRFQTS